MVSMNSKYGQSKYTKSAFDSEWKQAKKEFYQIFVAIHLANSSYGVIIELGKKYKMCLLKEEGDIF